MFWLLVRLLKVAPDDVPTDEIRDALGARLTSDGLQAEARFIQGGASERPYGWGWALALAAELETWDDPGGRRWAASFRPLSQAITGNFLRWLPVATYPLRTGVHTNSAFGISKALSYADLQPDGELSGALRGAASRWFGADEDYPGDWEPSGQDFLSAALCEAELLARLLPREDYPDWLGRFLPGIAGGQPAALFTPAVVTDSSDGYIAHLRGLNLSRAWCFRRLAESLPAGDRRVAVCEQASRATRRHRWRTWSATTTWSSIGSQPTRCCCSADFWQRESTSRGMPTFTDSSTSVRDFVAWLGRLRWRR
jgi:hypothetical protein